LNPHGNCKTIEDLSKEEAVVAIHFAYLQLVAIDATGSGFDNTPTINALRVCLIKAGHVDFTGSDKNSTFH
jgi:hypothetical protein